MLNQVDIEPEWKAVLDQYFNTPEFVNLTKVVAQQYQTKLVYPKPDDIFRAFFETPFSKVKVVILGQDPYHGLNQACGLSFSVQAGVKVPPSLQNIYKEIETELGIKKDFTNGNLQNWAKQGVFLLNSVLTVIASKPASHKNLGWDKFTDYVIQKLSDKKQNLVFILWGNFAKSKENLIDSSKHLVLKAAHPSPFSAYNGFFGCDHFKLSNEYLKNSGLGEIGW